MSQSIQSGKTSVSGSVTTSVASVSAYGNLLASQYATTSTTENKNILTVPASHEYYVVGFTMTSRVPVSGAATSLALLQLNAVTVGVTSTTGGASSTETSPSSIAFSAPSGSAFKLTAGQTATINHTSAASGVAFATVIYIDVTV